MSLEANCTGFEPRRQRAAFRFQDLFCTQASEVPRATGCGILKPGFETSATRRSAGSTRGVQRPRPPTRATLAVVLERCKQASSAVPPALARHPSPSRSGPSGPWPRIDLQFHEPSSRSTMLEMNLATSSIHASLLRPRRLHLRPPSATSFAVSDILSSVVQ